MFIPLDKFFANYGAYHNNWTNKAIHLVCIPLIVTSLQGLLMFTDKQYYFQDTLYSINNGNVLLIALLIMYSLIDLPAGLLSVCLYGGLSMRMNQVFFDWEGDK